MIYYQYSFKNTVDSLSTSPFNSLFKNFIEVSITSYTVLVSYWSKITFYSSLAYFETPNNSIIMYKYVIIKKNEYLFLKKFNNLLLKIRFYNDKNDILNIHRLHNI